MQTQSEFQKIEFQKLDIDRIFTENRAHHIDETPSRPAVQLGALAPVAPEIPEVYLKKEKDTLDRIDIPKIDTYKLIVGPRKMDMSSSVSFNPHTINDDASNVYLPDDLATDLAVDKNTITNPILQKLELQTEFKKLKSSLEEHRDKLLSYIESIKSFKKDLTFLNIEIQGDDNLESSSKQNLNIVDFLSNVRESIKNITNLIDSTKSNIKNLDDELRQEDNKIASSGDKIFTDLQNLKSEIATLESKNFEHKFKKFIQKIELLETTEKIKIELVETTEKIKGINPASKHEFKTLDPKKFNLQTDKGGDDGEFYSSNSITSTSKIIADPDLYPKSPLSPSKTSAFTRVNKKRSPDRLSGIAEETDKDTSISDQQKKELLHEILFTLENKMENKNSNQNADENSADNYAVKKLDDNKKWLSFLCPNSSLLRLGCCAGALDKDQKIQNSYFIFDQQLLVIQFDKIAYDSFKAFDETESISIAKEELKQKIETLITANIEVVDENSPDFKIKKINFDELNEAKIPKTIKKQIESFLKNSQSNNSVTLDADLVTAPSQIIAQAISGERIEEKQEREVAV